jgi:hypothetical protein
MCHLPAPTQLNNMGILGYLEYGRIVEIEGKTVYLTRQQKLIKLHLTVKEEGSPASFPTWLPKTTLLY